MYPSQFLFLSMYKPLKALHVKFLSTTNIPNTMM